MVGVMVLSNVLFPPTPSPLLRDSGVDSLGAVSGLPGVSTEPRDAVAAPAIAPDEAPTTAPSGAGADQAVIESSVAQNQIVTVRSDLYEYRFDTRGAQLVGASMLQYDSYAPDDVDDRIRGGDEVVELIRDGDAVLGYRVPTGGGDTISLADMILTPSTTSLQVTSGGEELRFTAPLGEVTFEIVYRFFPDDYRIEARGGLRGLEGRGHTVLMSLGHGLAMNEANENEDVTGMALVTRQRAGSIARVDLRKVDEDESRPIVGAPFSWAASKSKYWLAAVVSAADGPGFGGVVLRGLDEENAADMEVTLSVPAGSDGFEYVAYIGPQVQGRLQAIGQQLHNVNPYGWRWFQWFIRPFGSLVESVLIWMHESFSLAYGWVLILFGVLSRIVLFPLYQISMRQQMKQMAIQPELKKVQTKYKEDPQKLQKEMMKLYKEHGVNPLGSCIPMLLPFPILITLFFVFQNTIEFRGVPFLWLPDLSLKDPIYIVPFLMGGSMMFLSWIAQRGMESTQQTKILTYVLPVMMTFFFSQFAAGLNLYYTASNVASLPQQLYLSRERRRAQPKAQSGSDPKADEKAGAAKASSSAANESSGTKKTKKKRHKRAGLPGAQKRGSGQRK